MFYAIYISGTALCEWRETTITEVRFYNKFQTFHDIFMLLYLFDA